MSTPYWGQLPGPKVATAKVRRQSAGDYSPTEPRQSLDGPDQPRTRANRVSVQTTYTEAPTESTLSPYASPTTSSVAGHGLAPRPPSLPYATSQYPPELLEKRQRRRSRRSEEQEDPSATAPPAAPDVPRAPPVSYRNPHGNGGLPLTHPTRAPPLQTSSPANVDGMDPEAYYKESPTAERGAGYPVLDRTQKSLDRAAAAGARSRVVSEGEPPGRKPSASGKERERVVSLPDAAGQQQSRRASAASQSGGRGRKFADDRSPLQRLELTLDSITKEEKRARVEAAEERARERAARDGGGGGGGGAERSAGQQVRFSDRPSAEEEQAEHHSPAQRVVSTGRAALVDAHRGPLSQNPPEEGKRYGSSGAQPRALAPEPRQQAGGSSKSAMPQRNLSFRERAARNDIKLPSASPGEAELTASPPVTTPGSGISLTRSGSNKLKKDPPGDPWYSRRAEAEKKFGSVAKRRAGELDPAAPVVPSGAAVPRAPAAAPATGRNKALPPAPPAAEKRKAQAGNMNKAARILGTTELGGGVARRATEPMPSRRAAAAERDVDDDEEGEARTRQVGYETPPPGRAAAARRRRERDDSSSEGWEGDDHHHPISKLMYRAKDGLRPGEGMYNPPKFLDEWKKATVGTLSGALLDLSDDTAPGTERDQAWWESGGRQKGSMSSRPRKAEAFDGEYDETNAPTRFKPPLYLECGPLLRYCGMRHERIPTRSARNGAISEREIWRGTVMIVTRDADSSYEIAPTLRLFVQPIELLPPPPAEIKGEESLSPEYVDPIAGLPKLGRRGETLYVRPVEHLEEATDLSVKPVDEGLFEKTRSPPDVEGMTELPGSFASRRKRIDIDGEKVSRYKDVRGFRLHTERGYTFWRFNIEVELRERQQRIAYRINRGPATGFWVPARGQSMNIMFYSCNGFSKGVDTNELSGPDPMWRDVLNTHQTQPFHAMVGGGDQIYNDVVMDQCYLFHQWGKIKNPLHKHNMPFTQEMQDQLEEFYLKRYCMWFSQGLFGLANSQIPMVNMFDDHDIFDGYGSYPHHDMNSPVFSGLGSVAFKYYMLFQHQSVVDETETSEPSWILGENPGPYITELSRSLFMFLGSRMALLAIDGRTERTEFDVMRNGTWQKILDRLYAEISKGKADHLLVLLGVPVAYPRLVWLENILTSRLMDPIKALGKIGVLREKLNRIDGGVEVLDDLNDHWTAKNHKNERRIIIEDLQDFAAERSVRVTILSGDVHLAAVGQFYSNPKLGLPKHKDFRYMPNVISSAIVNTPPPDLLADVLNKRNKVHHFDSDTEEGMIPMFHFGVEGKPRNNKHLLPHRNWCSIRSWAPGSTPPPSPPLSAYDRSPSPPPVRPAAGGGGILRRLSKNRQPTIREQREPHDSRPPITGAGGGGAVGLFRSLSRRLSLSGGERPTPPKRTMSHTQNDNTAAAAGAARGPPPPSGRRFFGRRSSSDAPRRRQDDGGINGQWGSDDDSVDEDDYHHYVDRSRPPPARGGGGSGRWGGGGGGGDREDPREMRLRGGGAQDEYETGDESYFTARPSGGGARRGESERSPPTTGAVYGVTPDDEREYDEREYDDGGDGARSRSPRASAHPPAPAIKPFHRTPTGLSTKQMKNAAQFEVDLEGGLDIRLNVEINPKDPAGITVPYRLLVPRLFYEYEGEDVEAKRAKGFKKLLSFRKRKTSGGGPGGGPAPGAGGRPEDDEDDDYEEEDDAEQGSPVSASGRR